MEVTLQEVYEAVIIQRNNLMTESTILQIHVKKLQEEVDKINNNVEDSHK